MSCRFEMLICYVNAEWMICNADLLICNVDLSWEYLGFACCFYETFRMNLLTRHGMGAFGSLFLCFNVDPQASIVSSGISIPGVNLVSLKDANAGFTLCIASS